MSDSENILVCETNKGNYKLSVVAQFDYGTPVLYTIRIEKPSGERADYVSTLDGFRKFGELLLDLHSFAEEKLYTKDKQELKELLTADSIRTYVKFKKAAKFTK